MVSVQGLACIVVVSGKFQSSLAFDHSFKQKMDYDTVVLDIEGTITPITFVKDTLVTIQKLHTRLI